MERAPGPWWHARSVLLALVLSLGLSVPFMPAVPAAAAALIHLSRTVAAPGDAITVTGSGFTPGDPVVVTGTFLVSGHAQAVEAVATASASGSMSATIVVPAGAAPTAPNGGSPGPVVILARDFHGHAASQALTVLAVVNLTAGRTSSATVQADQVFIVRASGFRAGEQVTVTVPFPLYNGDVIVVTRTLVVDAQGRPVEIELQVPGGARAGTDRMTAHGSKSGRTAIANIAVVYRPSITVNPPAVVPGGSVTVHGEGFIPGSSITVSIPLVIPGVSSATVSRRVTADGHGAFAVSLATPPTTQLGTYTVTAAEDNQSLRASARVSVTVHPVVFVQPTSVLPGQTVTVTGGGFGLNVPVTVRVNVRLTSGASQTLTVAAATSGSGNLATHITIPGNTAAGTLTVVAISPHGQASAQLVVRQPPPIPHATSTPVPTSTPMPTATPTATVPPATRHGQQKPNFSFVSVWYHNVRVGSEEHVEVQGTPHTTLSIWAHVYFPNGRHYDYYEKTDSTGFWQKTFGVPKGALTQKSARVLITFRLWHGRHSKRTFRSFTVIR
jgi:hypothetical protein